VVEAVGTLRAGGVPEYAFPERAISTLGSMIRHRARMQMPPARAPRIDADRATVSAAIAHAAAAGRTFITEATAQRIASSYGISVPRAGVASDLSGALALAADIGYPVVLKIASPDILHKSDIGGIALGLTGPGEVRSTYERMMAGVRRRMPEARIWGVSVQEQLSPGHEVIIGVNRDPTFGPLVMFGLGGIYVEVLRDVTFRLAPVTYEEAREMIGEIRAAGILRGARGAPPADIDAIADVIVRVAALAGDFESITELDINPLIVGDRGRGAVAADIRIGIGG
jgi:acetyltransferase